MSKTMNFRRQHNDMMDLVSEITAHLDEKTVASASGDVASLLARLSGKLSVHLTQEDKFLYPRMKDSGNANAQRLALSFQNEMGGLSQTYTDFAKRYRGGRSIEADPAGFVREAKQIFSALKERIERENRDLYPAADQI